MIAPRVIHCRDALSEKEQGALLVDVRENHEYLTATVADAVHIPLSELIQPSLPTAVTETLGSATSIICFCQRGVRSKQAVSALQSAGYTNLATIDGGFKAWQSAGLPDSTPDNEYEFDAAQLDRYARHFSLPEIGLDGQARLLKSKVLIIGAGGLGSPVALYLAAAGVGKLGIIDDDIVERSNLQRQILHRDATRGSKKLISARQQLSALNPDIELQLIDRRLHADNASELVLGYDVVVDGSDNFPTRYAVNKACVRYGIPMVYAAVERFQAHLSVFWPAAPRTPSSGHDDTRLPCYECVFPLESDRPGCVEAGILGAVPGVAGTLQAVETIKLCLGIGQSLAGRLLRMDLLNMTVVSSRLRNDPACETCSQQAGLG